MGDGSLLAVDADRAAAAIGRGQHGVLSRHQAVQVGLGREAVRHRISTGRWEVVLPGVYRIAGAPSTWEQAVMSACLHAAAAASHRAAAALWGLAGIERRVVEIVSPRRIRVPGVVAHRTRVRTASIARAGAIPVTDPARTLLDLGGVVPPWVAGDALDDALRRDLVTLADLRQTLDLDGTRGLPGTGVLRRLLAERDPAAAVPESVLETRLARVLAASSLPAPVRQHEVPVAGRTARLDFAWPDRMVAVEADGYRFHSSARAWSNDRARRNLLTQAGWRVVHVTWDDVRSRPEATLATIRAALLETEPRTPAVVETP